MQKEMRPFTRFETRPWYDLSFSERFYGCYIVIVYVQGHRIVVIRQAEERKRGQQVMMMSMGWLWEGASKSKQSPQGILMN